MVGTIETHRRPILEIAIWKLPSRIEKEIDEEIGLPLAKTICSGRRDLWASPNIISRAANCWSRYVP
jgi:hypothetical protein